MPDSINRRQSLKKIKDPDDDDNFVMIPVTDQITFRDPKSFAQEYVFRFNNTESAGRVAHVRRVKQKIGMPTDYTEDDSNYVEVERIDRLGAVDPKSFAQGTGFRFDNRDEPESWPALPGVLDEVEQPARYRHVVRYTADNTLAGVPWVDVELIDLFSVKDPKSFGQETIYRITYAERGPPIADPDDPYQPTFAFADHDLPTAEEGSTEIDPPYRIDPFQNIVNVSWGGVSWITTSYDGVNSRYLARVWKANGELIWSTTGELIAVGTIPAAQPTLDRSLNGYVVEGGGEDSAPVYVRQLAWDAENEIISQSWRTQIGIVSDGSTRTSVVGLAGMAQGVVVATETFDYSDDTVVDNKIYRLGDDGEILWQKTLDATVRIATDGSSVYMAKSGLLTAYDADGVSQWTLDLLYSTYLAVRGKWIVVADSTHVAVYPLVADQDNQRPLKWQATIPTEISAIGFINSIDIDRAGNVFATAIGIDFSDPVFVARHAWILKWNSDGQLIWNEEIGDEPNYTNAEVIEQTSSLFGTVYMTIREEENVGGSVYGGVSLGGGRFAAISYPNFHTFVSSVTTEDHDEIDPIHGPYILTIYTYHFSYDDFPEAVIYKNPDASNIWSTENGRTLIDADTGFVTNVDWIGIGRAS